MIISERQIMQLMTIARDFMVILSLINGEEKYKNQYNDISSLLSVIANQQPEELKVIE